MKNTPLLWIGCLCLVLSGCGREKKEAAGADAAPPAVGVGVAAAAESGPRFELWLLAHQPDKTVPPVAPGKIIGDSLKDFDVPTLLAHAGMPDWQARIQWSWDDMGPMDPEGQRELARLDGKYSMNSYAACVWPGSGLVGRVGRACAMQSYACQAARTKMDAQAMDLTLAVEMPNETALQSLRSAGANAVAEFLRTNKFCK